MVAPFAGERGQIVGLSSSSSIDTMCVIGFVFVARVVAVKSGKTSQDPRNQGRGQRRRDDQHADQSGSSPLLACFDGGIKSVGFDNSSDPSFLKEARPPSFHCRYSAHHRDLALPPLPRHPVKHSARPPDGLLGTESVEVPPVSPM